MIKETDLKVLFSETQLQKRIKELADELNHFYQDEEIVVICVLKGSIMFCTDLIKHLKMPLRIECIRLSSYGSNRTSSGRVKSLDLSLPDITNKNVLIIEDIIDTGNTAKFLLDYIKHSFSTKSTKFCSLLDKKCRRTTDIDADIVGFEIDDKFVVGYGLDYEGFYRNLPYVGYVDD